jgi:hypothetical protein
MAGITENDVPVSQNMTNVMAQKIALLVLAVVLLRAAVHISGGCGSCASTATARVHVVF